MKAFLIFLVITLILNIFFKNPIEIVWKWGPYPARGRTLGPFIFYKTQVDKNNEKLREHEWIHWEQQRELYFAGWWALYSYYYLAGLIKYWIHGPIGFRYYRSIGKRGAHWHAYKNNPFEVEASKGEIMKRDAFDWMDFI